MTLVTSFRASSFFNWSKRDLESGIGCSSNFSGTMGRVSSRQKPYFFLSMSSGICSPTRWPTADEITYSSFSKWSPCFGTLPSARAKSAATEGFSAIMRHFMWGRAVTPRLHEVQEILFFVTPLTVEQYEFTRAIFFRHHEQRTIAQLGQKLLVGNYFVGRNFGRGG